MLIEKKISRKAIAIYSGIIIFFLAASGLLVYYEYRIGRSGVSQIVQKGNNQPPADQEDKMAKAKKSIGFEAFVSDEKFKSLKENPFFEPKYADVVGNERLFNDPGAPEPEKARETK